jgi:ACS family hexuronate transporter-like MFS transporter
MTSPTLENSSNRKWLVCGMLLLALVLNYMDRQTLSLTITAIEKEIHLNNTQYGRLEKGFGYAFAFGGLAFGVLADRVSVKWLYPFVLMGWSAAGLATGYADRLGQWITPILGRMFDVQELALTNDPEITRSYIGFLVCRITLGFFEAGQWPCALVTTARLLSRADRSFGNSILQSGASIGAILTPIVVGFFAPATPDSTQSVGWWRMPYVVIGVLGLLWVVPWLAMVWRLDLRRPGSATDPNAAKQALSSTALPWSRQLSRYAALIVVVITINMTWQYFRVWLPKMLEQYHGYPPEQVRWFVMAYYIATDIGCIAAGATVKLLAARWTTVHTARMTTFAICAALTALSTVASMLPRGPLLLSVFLLIGFGALGLFPNYYSFTQELSGRHQGKVTGSLGFITWVVSSEMQELVGKRIDKSGSYEDGIFWIGLVPLLGLLAMFLFWGKNPDTPPTAAKDLGS